MVNLTVAVLLSLGFASSVEVVFLLLRAAKREIKFQLRNQTSMAFCQFHYHSKSLAMQATAWVILPDGPGPFSVLYLLHGYSDDHTIWCRRTSLERYAESYPSLMIVMPAGGHKLLLRCGQGPRL